MLIRNDVFKLSMLKLSLFKLSRRLRVLLGANGQPGSMAIGNILMLLIKPPTAQGGNAFSFPHPGITKVGPPLAKLLERLESACLKPEWGKTDPDSKPERLPQSRQLTT